VIWIRKVRETKAALQEVRATGTFTFGVQFKDDTHAWRSLEYDLTKYRGGVLKDYDVES